MLAFGFDIGNGFVKARNSKRLVVAPSTIAKKESVGKSSIASMSEEYDNAEGYQTYVSNLDEGTEYAWGEGIKTAVDAEDLIATYTHNNRYSQKRFKLLCSFLLAELSSDFKEKDLNDVTVVTGLPSAEVGSKEAEEFKKFLQQKHLISRNGKQLVINVTEVRILEQPLGTLLNKYMNASGQIHKVLLTSTITVIDFGAGTTIMDTFKNLKRIEDKSDTFYEGQNDIHKRIAKQVEKQYGVKGVGMHHIEKAFYNDTLVATLSERKKYSFEDIAVKVIKVFNDKMISDIDSVLTNRNSTDLFVATGGGVNIVGDDFKKEFNEETLEIVEDSQEANANGYYNLAKNIVNNKKKQNK